MTRILTIILSALVLTGCADGYDKSAGINDCKRAASGGQVYLPEFGDANTSEHDFGGTPGRNLPGGGRDLLHHDTSAYKCVHKEDNKENKPETSDLQKLGAARKLIEEWEALI